jgi:hypothetical protein
MKTAIAWIIGIAIIVLMASMLWSNGAQAQGTEKYNHYESREDLENKLMGTFAQDKPEGSCCMIVVGQKVCHEC